MTRSKAAIHRQPEGGENNTKCMIRLIVHFAQPKMSHLHTSCNDKFRGSGRQSKWAVMHSKCRTNTAASKTKYGIKFDRIRICICICVTHSINSPSNSVSASLRSFEHKRRTKRDHVWGNLDWYHKNQLHLTEIDFRSMEPVFAPMRRQSCTLLCSCTKTNP